MRLGNRNLWLANLAKLLGQFLWLCQGLHWSYTVLLTAILPINLHQLSLSVNTGCITSLSFCKEALSFSACLAYATSPAADHGCKDMEVAVRLSLRASDPSHLHIPRTLQCAVIVTCRRVLGVDHLPPGKIPKGPQRFLRARARASSLRFSSSASSLMNFS